MSDHRGSSRRSRQPAVRTGIPQRGDLALRHTGQARVEEDDTGENQPPSPAQSPANLGAGDTGVEELAARDDASLIPGAMDENVWKIQGVHGGRSRGAQPDCACVRWTA